tara:strand:- start:9318 stop:10727 length:1410 start_codon:yes stop_codon:yes gene_type:complete
MNTIQSFSYGTEKYSFAVRLLDGRYGSENILDLIESNYTDTEGRITRLLPNSNIKKISIESSLIDPILKANIVFQDNEKEVMLNTFNNLNLFCTISIVSQPDRSKSLLSDDNYGEVFNFNHTFYVNKAKILEKRDNGVVVYSIDLISTLFFSFMQTAPVTTHSREANVYRSTMKFGQIVRSIFGGVDSDKSTKIINNELVLKSTTKDTDVDIEHMSPAGSTRLSNLMAILSKNVETPESDLVFVPYDHIEKQHELWFKSDFITSVGASDYRIHRNILDIKANANPSSRLLFTDIESIQSDSITNNQDVIKNMFDTVEHGYDYNYRKFSKKSTITTQSIQRGFSAISRNSSDESKFTFDTSLLKQGDNNQIFEGIDPDGLNFYKRMVDSLIKNNVVTVRTPGRLPRKPGIDMFIRVDDVNDPTPLRDLIGRWLVTSINHVFDLANEKYSNIMTLSSSTLRDDFSKNRSLV